MSAGTHVDSGALRAPTIGDYLQATAHPRRQSGGRRRPSHVPGLPLVSVVTIVRNRRDTVAQTIRSVAAQSYANIEYVVVDGGSTDGTLEVLRQLEGHIDLWISEPDRNSSDAMNKAISLTSGEFVYWLSADDWIDPDFIDVATGLLKNSQADFACGDVRIYDGDHFAWLRRGAACDGTLEPFVSGERTLNFASMVMRRSCFERIGLFDLRYKSSNDYEWLVRLHLAGGRCLYDPRLVCHFRLGGTSSAGGFRPILETVQVLGDHGLLSPAVLLRRTRTLARFTAGYLLRRCIPASAYRKIRKAARS